MRKTPHLLSLAALCLLRVHDVSGATVTVTSSANNTTVDGQVTLREAISSINNGANLNADVVAAGVYGADDTIQFNIPGVGVRTINLALMPPTSPGALPAITRTVIIDGFSQPGSSFGTPMIELNGTGAVGVASGLNLTNVANCLIRGLVINRHSGNGILISGAAATGNRIQGNFLGPNASGDAGFYEFGNTQQFGVTVQNGAQGNFIGTDGDGINDAAEGNLISGNSEQGVTIDGTGTSNNRVAGNRIGTNAAGNAAVPNKPTGGTGGGLGIQSGATNNVIGTNADGVSDALEANTISGNGSGLGISGGPATAGNLVSGNFIGTNPTGETAIPNLNDGVTISNAANNVVGTNGDGVNDAVERNVISGNAGLGLRISVNSFGNRVAGNYIGVDVHGTGALGNVFRGISIESGANNNIIGTNGDGIGDALEGNIVSATTTTIAGFGQGISVAGTTVASNRVAGNRIGTNAAGTAALPNVAGGLQIASGAKNNLIGTNGDGISDALEANTISGNTSFGVRIVSAGTTGNVLAGNRIGTDPTGVTDLGNNGSGVLIDSGAASNVIGGAAPRGNIIAFNAKGVVVGTSTADTAAIRNAISSNSIYLNDGLGIDLGNDDVTLNDVNDADDGPNTRLNYPVVTGVTIGGNHLVLEGFARPGSLIEFFAAAADPTGFGEGQTFLASLVEGSSADTDGGVGSYGPTIGSLSVGSDTTNRFRFVVPLGGLPPVGAGTLITATATIDSSTSEFGPYAALLLPDLSITKAGPRFAQPGTNLTYTVAVSNGGLGEATGVLVNDPGPPGLSFVSSSAPCSTFPCVIPSIPAGATLAMSVTFSIPPTYLTPTAIVNVATLGDPLTAITDPKRHAVVTTVLASADLGITKTGPLLQAVRGDPLTFTLVIRNNGPQDAVDVVVADPTPAGLEFVGNGGACSTPFPCMLGTMAVGEVRIIQANYTVPFDVTAPIVNTATVSSTTTDPNLSNNQSSTSTPRRTDLSISKTGPAVVTVGQSVAYTIVVSNLGPSGVPQLTIDDPTPEGLTLVATTGACTDGFPCTIGPLPSGRSLTVLATYRAEPGGSGTLLENTATVSSPVPDPVPDNNTATASTTLEPDTDDDGDELPDDCEAAAGLPSTSSASGDDDGDGITNLAECQTGTHPRGFVQQFLPEGATGSFFTAKLTLESEADVDAHVLIHYEPENQPETHAWLLLPVRARTTLNITDFIGVASFATRIESDVAISLERTMTWRGGGGHADIATSSLSTTWYFAEGATTGEFSLYYLLQNPNSEPTRVDVTFLVDSSGPVVRTYDLPPMSRTSIWTNSIPELAEANVSVVIASHDLPIAAARAMYRDWSGQDHVAGGTASGSGTASLDWYFAEGATSGFFDTWLLLANADASDALVDVTYYPNGTPPIVRSMTIPAQRRITVRVSDVDPGLAAADVAMHVRATGGIPVVAERSMWWPSPNYYEGHQSSGALQPAPVWRFGQGLVETNSETYLLVANFARRAGQVLLTIAYDNGEESTRVLDIGAESRITVNVRDLVPEVLDRRFRIELASLGSPLPLVVERSIYTDVFGRTWGMGTTLVGTPVRASTTPP